MRTRTSEEMPAVSGECGMVAQEPKVIVDRKALLPQRRVRARFQICRIDSEQ